jgi:hypothetical protein
MAALVQISMHPTAFLCSKLPLCGYKSQCGAIGGEGEGACAPPTVISWFIMIFKTTKYLPQQLALA